MTHLHGPGKVAAPFYSLLFSGRAGAALARLAAARGAAMRDGEWDLVGRLSELTGEAHFHLGEYGQALDWYRQAEELDPDRSGKGCTSTTAILLDQGEPDQAEAQGRRTVGLLAEVGDTWCVPWARLHLARALTALGRYVEAEAELRAAIAAASAPAGEPAFAVLAQAYLAELARVQDDGVSFRQLGEVALTQARRCSPFVRAQVALLVLPARQMWGQREAATTLLEEAMAVLQEANARWWLHAGHLHWSRLRSGEGDESAVREHLAAALVPAAREGYVQWIWHERDWTLALLATAIAGGTEVAFCQELLIRSGEDAVDLLRQLITAPEPGGRQAALYPLAVVGGKKAAALVRHALYDGDAEVREAALLAYRHLLRQHPEMGLEGAPEPEGLPPGVVPPDPATGASPAPVGLPAAAAGAVTAARATAAAVMVDVRMPVAVRCLGDFTVQVAGAAVRFRTQKARDLLAFLATHRGQPASKERLMEALWPESDPEAMQELFHTTVYQLRRALKPMGQEVITFAAGLYRLERSLLEVDMDLFLKLAGGQDPAEWAGAVQAYGGDFLGELDYAWCDGPRNHLREVYLQLLHRLGRHEQEGGNPGAAALWWQRLLEIDPLGEEAHLALVRCYVETGRKALAVQQYRTLVRLLQRELGVGPSPSAQSLAKRLLG